MTSRFSLAVRTLIISNGTFSLLVASSPHLVSKLLHVAGVCVALHDLELLHQSFLFEVLLEAQCENKKHEPASENKRQNISQKPKYSVKMHYTHFRKVRNYILRGHGCYRCKNHQREAVHHFLFPPRLNPLK